MTVFRLCRHDRTALDGTGGLYADGRWHRLGSRIVYAASTVSLALVEVRVHHQMAPLGWVSLEIDAPSHLIEHLDLAILPTGWQDDRNHTQTAGEEWLAGRRSAMLAVPSVIVPRAKNYLINPLHPAAVQIRLVESTPFSFDPRLFGGPHP